MANELNLPSPNINPGVIGGGGFAPNPIDLFLQAYTQSKTLKGSEDERKAQLEIQKAHLGLAAQAFDLQKGQQEQETARLQHEHDLQLEIGKGIQTILKGHAGAMDQRAQTTGQLPPMVQSILGIDQQPPAGARSPQASGVPQPPTQTPNVAPSPVSAPAAPTWSQVVGEMSPEAAAQFVHQDLPTLIKAMDEASGEKPQAIQTGDTVTTFVPGKGFWDEKQQKFVPSIERHKPPEEIAMKKLELQLAGERIGAMQDYRTAIRGQSMTRSFLNQTKKLQDKGRVLQQAVMNITDALDSPDPAKRRLLASVAILSFQSAAEVVQPQLRYQMVQWFKKNVDQSFTGKIENLGSLAAKGEYPPATYRAMVSHLTDILAQQRSEYEKQRQGEIKRHPDLANWLPEADEFFTADRINPTAPTDLQPPP